MNDLPALQDLVGTVEIPLGGFVLNTILAALLSFLLGLIFVKYGKTISNRRLFASNFVLITMTTVLIISVVKSSLALSLGLVGALSIVRFRAAIKEPEELSYLFLTIGIGLGFGADQRLITVTAFGVISAFLVLRGVGARDEENSNLFLTIASRSREKVELAAMVEALKQHCSGVKLKRFDETEGALEALFVVDVESFDQLNRCKAELQGLSHDVQVTFVENRGIV